MSTPSVRNATLAGNTAAPAATKTHAGFRPQAPPEDKTMKTHPRFPTRTARLRAAFAGAAFAAAATLVFAVVAAFDSVSREPFLRDTPEARLAVARCDMLGERQARQHCLQRLVAAAKASGAGASRVAAVETERRRR